MKDEGLIHIYYGDGKGKTTAAIGLGVRASGHGYNVLMLQFLKSEGSGEQIFLDGNDSFVIESVCKTVKFVHEMTKEEKEICENQNEKALIDAFHRCGEEQVDMVILDEITDCVNTGLLNKTLMRNLLMTKDPYLEVVLTGRKPDDDIIRLADYVSEVKMIKHPYEKGITARKGIEM